MNSHTSVPRKISETVEPWEDPIVREVRDARHRLAARFDNDLEQIAENLMLAPSRPWFPHGQPPPLRKKVL